MRSKTVGWMRLVVVGAFILGCGDSTEPRPPCADPDGGQFNGGFGMGDQNSLRGCTSYAVTSSGGSTNTILVVSVGPLAAPTTMVSLIRPGARPAMGTYEVGVDPGDFSGAILHDGSSFSITSGSVIVDAALPDELQGSFSVTGEQSGSGAMITIAGTFKAVCTAIGSVTC